MSYIRFFQESYERVKQLPENIFRLIKDEQEIIKVGKQIGIPDVEEFPSIYVLEKDGKYKQVYGCFSKEPKSTDPVTKIY